MKFGAHEVKKVPIIKKKTPENHPLHVCEIYHFSVRLFYHVYTVLYCPDKNLINSTSVHCEHGRLCLIWWGVSKLKGRINRHQLQQIHGLWTHNKAFFIEIPNFWARADNLGHLGYFRPNYQHTFWYIDHPLFLQKSKPSNPHPK